MKTFKIVLVTTCLSFTMVVLINTFIGVFTGHSQYLNAINILQIALSCLLVSIGIAIGSINRFYQDHFYTFSYFVMMIVVFGMEYIFRGHFSWESLFLEVIALTLIYLGVCFLSLHENEKDADLINKKIKSRSH